VTIYISLYVYIRIVYIYTSPLYAVVGITLYYYSSAAPCRVLGPARATAISQWIRIIRLRVRSSVHWHSCANIHWVMRTYILHIKRYSTYIGGWAYLTLFYTRSASPFCLVSRAPTEFPVGNRIDIVGVRRFYLVRIKNDESTSATRRVPIRRTIDAW